MEEGGGGKQLRVEGKKMEWMFILDNCTCLKCQCHFSSYGDLVNHGKYEWQNHFQF